VASTSASDTTMSTAPISIASTIDSTVTVTVFAAHRFCRKRLMNESSFSGGGASFCATATASSVVTRCSSRRRKP
jgi:hypothetical protein